MDDMYAKGRRSRRKPYKRKDDRKIRKLSQADIEMIQRELETPYWGQVNDLAKRFGVAHSLISNIKCGRDGRVSSK
jgi:transcriptional regulator with XRE-family HTH domain